MSNTAIPAKYHTRAEQLATAHWNYIFELLTAHNVDDNTIAVAEFHYKSAAVHFYKHAIEDWLVESGTVTLPTNKTDRRPGDMYE